MCIFCRKTPAGLELWEALKAARQAVREAGLNPDIAGFMQKYDARKVINEQPTDQPFFEDSEADVLNKMLEAKAAVDKYHQEYIKSPFDKRKEQN